MAEIEGVRREGKEEGRAHEAREDGRLKIAKKYTAVLRKVVQKKHKSVRDNTERHYGELSV